MNVPPPRSQQQKIVVNLAVLAVTAVIVLGVKGFADHNAAGHAAPSVAKGSSPSVPSSSANSASAPSPASNAAAPPGTVSYKDGTYMATGSYDSPGGFQSIQVSMTLQHDIITGTSAQNRATDSDSQQFQDDFIANYRSYVVGKDITAVHLTNVAGSSLTSQGFNDALNRIKSQARS